MPGAMSTMGGARSAPGSTALAQTRGAHATLRLDNFLKHTDSGYQHAESQTHGDRFIRKMATYGQVRPSVSFTSESRVVRPMKEHGAVDMSNLPNPLLDPRGDPKEGTLSIPGPPKEVDNSYLKLMANDSLMLPSERLREHKQIKEAQQKWKEDRESLFRYRKRMNVLERHYPNGVAGMDGPMMPGTQLYAERREHFLVQEEGKVYQGAGRHDHLHGQTRAADATAARGYGSDPQLPRSHDVCIQRKRVDKEAHPQRFKDTHDRLFPSYSPAWDPSRAATIRNHDTRGKTHNIISGVDNHVELRVAQVHETPPLRGMPHVASHPGFSNFADES